MIFACPEFLWFLLLAPVTAWLLWWAARRRRRQMTDFINPRLLNSLMSGVSPARRRFRAACLVAAVALLAFAMARPQWGFQWEEVKQRGLDIIVAIDTSRSMLAEDIKPNRLERAKLAALDLAHQARKDRVALVAFAGSAFMQCPLTLDEEAFRQSVTMLDTEIIPQGGTAIAEAITVARCAFTNDSDNHQVLVIFSDGEDHEEGVMEAAEQAHKAGMKIFTVGVGTPEGDDLRAEVAREGDGGKVHTQLAERQLDKLAKAADGTYQRLAGARTIENLYEKHLAPLPKAEHSARQIRQYFERFHWPLGLAVLLLIIEILLPDRPMNQRWNIRGAAACFMAGLLLAGASVSAASPGEARKQLDAGRNKAAKESYQQLLVKTPEDPRLHYNLGVAAFRDKDFSRAEREFDAATLSPDNLALQQQAYYNQGEALYRLGEAADKPEEKMEKWKQATNSFTRALRLNTNDVDASYNLDYVTKKIQEFQQQQQQQQGDGESKDQQNQQDKNDQQEKQSQQNQQKQDSQQQRDQSQSNGQDKKDEKDKQGKQSPDQQSGEKDKEQNQAQKDQGKDKQQQAQQGEKGEEKDGDSQNATSQQMTAIMMTPEQAKQLLEAAKIEEKVLPFNQLPPESRKRPNRSMKNW